MGLGQSTHVSIVPIPTYCYEDRKKWRFKSMDSRIYNTCEFSHVTLVMSFASGSPFKNGNSNSILLILLCICFVILTFLLCGCILISHSFTTYNNLQLFVNKMALEIQVV